MRENRANFIFFAKMLVKSLSLSVGAAGVIFVSIALGAAITAAFINIYLDIDSKMNRELKSYGANFIIAPKNTYMSEEAYQNALSNIQSDRLLGASAYLYGIVRLELGNAVIAGVNFKELKKAKPFLEVREGNYINLDFDDFGALAGVDLAKKMELKVGSSVDMIGADGKVIKIKIRGIVSSGGKEDSILFVPLSTAQSALGKEGLINFADIVALGDFEELRALGERINQNAALTAKPVTAISRSEGVILEKIKLLMALVALSVLLITSLCVNTTLSSIILARMKEIALLRALGASKKSIVRLFGMETFIMAFIASLAGAGFGFLLSQAFGHAIFNSGIDFRFLSIPSAVLISLLFAAAACFLPIKKSLGINVANILRGE
ncbi:MAG: FtsX-like permease family protein [Campylobacteraceae bacterium]|jgi:putative ABC transport system permease protein|nr:FtsX-like permease family protein [Campylobacteraceae bacterium]